MTVTKIGAVPRFNSSVKNFLDLSELLLSYKVDGLFATDHTRNKDFFADTHPSCPVVLGLWRSRFKNTPLGPLVSRVGSGLDEHVMSMLDTLGGPLVVSLGIGDSKGRAENDISSLPWPTIDERWDRLCSVSERCINRGLETYAATDKASLVEKLPSGVGVHVQHVSGTNFTNRPLARGVFSKTNTDFIEYSIKNSFSWVVLAQSKDESNVSYVNRIKSVIKLRNSFV